MSRRRRITPIHGSLYDGGAAAPADSAELTQFLARITAPTAPRKAAYAALIDGLVVDGVWSLIDALYIMAAADAATARTNLKQSSYGLTPSGSGLTFTADRGYTGNGSSGWINTGYDPNTAGGNFPSTGNSGTLAAYCLTSETTGGFAYAMHTGGAVSYIAPLFGGDIYINIGGGGYNSTAGANQRGNVMAVRTSSAASAMTIYKNGTSSAAGGGATAGGSIGAIALFAATGGGGSFLAQEMCAAMIGAGMNGTQALAYMSRVNTYMTTLGINVY